MPQIGPHVQGHGKRAQMQLLHIGPYAQPCKSTRMFVGQRGGFAALGFHLKDEVQPNLAG